ncbi:MAG: tail fiber assembly protein [Deferribacterales bacterium]
MHKYYVKFDENGFLSASYPAGVYKTQPDGTFEVSAAVWTDLMNAQGERRWDGEKVVEYVRQQTDEELAAAIRSKRDTLIAETDYLVMPDYPLSDTILTAVKEYRQALRDITAQEAFPASVTWPEKPEI